MLGLPVDFKGNIRSVARNLPQTITITKISLQPDDCTTTTTVGLTQFVGLNQIDNLF